MAIEALLQRPGLSAQIRLLVAAAVAVWRADWSLLQECARLMQTLGRPRQDLEETLLQAVLFCGFPRVITAFGKLSETWPADVAPSGGSLPPAERRAAGEALFGAIYGDNEASVRAMLKDCHEELHDFVFDAAYGRILSRPRLPAGTREILAVALLAAQGQPRQFLGHARGAMRLGASRLQLCEALVTAFSDRGEAATEVAAWVARLR